MTNPVLATMAFGCIMSHVRDPETEKMGWLVKCYDASRIEYTSPAFVKQKRVARGVAVRWLNARRPKFTVSVTDLKNGK